MTTEQKKSELKTDIIKSKIRDKVKDWTPEQVKAHVDRVTKIYSTRRKGELLGNFDWDSENHYYWHTYTRDSQKLTDRLAMGYGFATKDDAVNSGLLNDSVSSVSTVDGETCVEMSHKSHRAVLLKIPKELYQLNEVTKYRARNNQASKSYDGQTVQKQEITKGNSTTVYLKEPTLEVK
jgi:hypothetical protein